MNALPSLVKPVEKANDAVWLEACNDNDQQAVDQQVHIAAAASHIVVHPGAYPTFG